MAYEKQIFSDGQVLTADAVNHMEDGIEAAHKSADANAMAVQQAQSTASSAEEKAGLAQSAASSAESAASSAGENARKAMSDVDALKMAMGGSSDYASIFVNELTGESA